MKKNVVIIMGWLLFGLKLSAQQPINISIIAPATPSPYLESLADPINGMIGTIILLDVNQPTYSARLKLTISGEGGIQLRTPDHVMHIVDLTANVPHMLMGPDWANFVDPYNLEFQGISQSDFIAGGGLLPEGNYTICLEAFDVNRVTDPAVSNNGCSFRTFELFQPPLLIAPLETATEHTPQTVLFNWMPLHIGMFMTEYELQIWEAEEGLATNQIIDYHPVLFQTNTGPLQTYNYTVVDPLLEVGKEYIWRVQVSTIDDQPIFANNGYSEIGTFVYGEAESFHAMACLPPINYTLALDADNNIVVNWEAPTPLHEGATFEMRYRNTVNEWTTADEHHLLDSPHTISGLDPGTYEVEIF